MVQTKEERKAKNKAREQTPENKAKRKERYSSPENKAKAKARRETPEYKAKEKTRKQTTEYKAKAKARKQIPEYKDWRKKYDARPKNKAKAKARKQRPENRAKAKEFADESRLKILQTYSKRLSNSNIPCCKCCGKNSHVDFLSIDHIAGKKQMDSEPELVKLGYSSKLTSGSLRKFLIENDFPPYFQILCHNCNSAKNFSKHNKCPLENKPH